MNLKETLLLSAAVGFFLIWMGELFNGIPLKASYIWAMGSIACLLYFQYAKNVRLKQEEERVATKRSTGGIEKKQISLKRKGRKA
ncbi:MAG: hypothetical protein LH606_05335 [Cytophagaceae bacterium]|nr:hypothetical protein [Cytophagaceae bacterium]